MVKVNNGKAILTSLAVIGLISYLANRMDFIKPVIARITSPFGTRTNPVTKKTEFHNGIDLAVPIGTPVKAPASAKVLNVYSNDLGGLQMILKHDNGFTSGYAHLSKAILKVGDIVKQGDIIALTGNSGRTTGAHLHFSLRDDKGNFINPEHFVYTA